jgi:hypothetical protein
VNKLRGALSENEMVMTVHNGSALAKGQVWKTGIADIEIMGLSKRLIQYKVTKQVGHRRVSTQISAVEAMRAYLKRNAAQLASN